MVVFASTAARDLDRIPPRIVPTVIEYVYVNRSASS
jgi:hypothetical protein